MTNLLLVCLVSLGGLGQGSVADNPELARMEVDSSAMLKDGKYQELIKAAPAQRARILAMVEGDQLKTAPDFLRASSLYDDSQGWFEVRRAQHEFALMALALGSDQAGGALKRTWDFLMISMGKRQRFGFVKSDPKHDPTGRYLPEAVPATIRRVFDDPAGAREASAKSQDNAEIRKLREQDQAVRTGKVDPKALEQAAEQDRARQKRVLELIAKGVPQTPNDFESLSLIMQHGAGFDEYRLAHELMMAAKLLGYESPWLLTATYDRMMLSAGHRQRYGTQWWQSGLAPLDTVALNDRMRKQMGLQSLAEIRAREQEILKRFFGGG